MVHNRTSLQKFKWVICQIKDTLYIKPNLKNKTYFIALLQIIIGCIDVFYWQIVLNNTEPPEFKEPRFTFELTEFPVVQPITAQYTAFLLAGFVPLFFGCILLIANLGKSPIFLQLWIISTIFQIISFTICFLTKAIYLLIAKNIHMGLLFLGITTLVNAIIYYIITIVADYRREMIHDSVMLCTNVTIPRSAKLAAIRREGDAIF